MDSHTSRRSADDNDPSSSPPPEAAIRELARLADLDLDEERIRRLTPPLLELLSGLKKMDELDLGETAPEPTFRA